MAAHMLFWRLKCMPLDMRSRTVVLSPGVGNGESKPHDTMGASIERSVTLPCAATCQSARRLAPDPARARASRPA